MTITMAFCQLETADSRLSLAITDQFNLRVTFTTRQLVLYLIFFITRLLS